MGVAECTTLVLEEECDDLVGAACRNPTLAKCGGEAQHLEKLGDLESSGTPECSELDRKGQNTSHWGVLGVVEKVLKRRYR